MLLTMMMVNTSTEHGQHNIFKPPKICSLFMLVIVEWFISNMKYLHKIIHREKIKENIENDSDIRI
jgi:hypothetical protein